MRRQAAGLALALLLTGCGTGRYAGLDLRRGALSAPLRQLALAARSGDKQAQLALGDRFAAGLDVPHDLARARTLYAQAARASGGTLWIYSPPVGKEAAGRVVPVAAPVVPGLPAAAARLAALDAPTR